MNQAQLTSLIKQLLNALGGYLTVHGAATAASVVNAQDTAGLLTLLGVWVYSHFFQHTDVNEATPTPLPASKGGGVLPPASLLFIVGISAATMVFFMAGCAGQNKRLELGGAYAPATQLVLTNTADGSITTNNVATSPADFKLYAADASFDFAYSALEAAFKIERDNRAFLWKLSPDIKHSLDAIRPNATKAVQAYTLARMKYIASPLDANATELDAALQVVQTLSDAASVATSRITIK